MHWKASQASRPKLNLFLALIRMSHLKGTVMLHQTKFNLGATEKMKLHRTFGFSCFHNPELRQAGCQGWWSDYDYEY